MSDRTIDRVIQELTGKYPQASDFVIRPDGIVVISSKKVVGKEFISSQDYEDIVFSIVPNSEVKDYDTSLESNGIRFRVNIAKFMGGFDITLRWLRDIEVPVPERIEKQIIDESVLTRLEKKQGGIILVIGPTGSGKSTLMNAVLNLILRKFPARVITIEDPVEYTIKEGIGSVVQREVGSDTDSFYRALKSSLRQNPNIIFVGEIRDRETVELLLQASDTGHIVFATLHTDQASDTLERLIGMLEVEKVENSLKLLAKNLIGILGTRLFDIDGKKVMIYEYLAVEKDKAVQSLIVRKEFVNIKTYGNNIETGHIPFDLSVADLLKAKVIQEKDLDILPISNKQRVLMLSRK